MAAAAASTCLPELPVLPDAIWLVIAQTLDPHSLASLSAASKDLASLETDQLWEAACARAGVRKSALAPKRRYARFAETRCHECRKHTRYEFTLLRRRLCESCERGHPHTYGLVNSMQLSFECSEFGRLLASERAHVLRSLPSIKIHNYDWFQRGAVTDKARAMLREVEASSRQVSRPIFPTRHTPFSLHITGFFFSI